MDICLHFFDRKSDVLGPYERTIIWVQGCNRRCKGCISPMSRPINQGTVISTKELTDMIDFSLEGITISGGEPFLQAKALCEVCRDVRKRGLGIIIYSGYTYEQLKLLKDRYVDELLSYCDLLIDGEYIEDKDDGKAGRGSSNQNFIYLSDRYKDSDYYDQDRQYDIYHEGDLYVLEGIPDETGKILFDAISGE